MAKQFKCVGCGDAYTNKELRDQRGYNQPYLLLRRGKLYFFLCPSCYEDYVHLSKAEQQEMIGAGWMRHDSA